MGQIQSAINQGITGTSFLLGQSGGVKNMSGSYELKKDIEAADIEAKKLKEEYAHAITDEQRKSIQDTAIKAAEKHYNTQSDIKLRTPKYRDEEIQRRAERNAKMNYLQRLKNRVDKVVKQRDRQEQFLEMLKNPNATNDDIKNLLGGGSK